SSTIELATIKGVHKGEPLTIDYATLRDPDMPSFRCRCGEPTCRGIVKSQTAKVRESGLDKMKLKHKAATSPLRSRGASPAPPACAGSDASASSSSNSASTPSSAATKTAPQPKSTPSDTTSKTTTTSEETAP